MAGSVTAASSPDVPRRRSSIVVSDEVAHLRRVQGDGGARSGTLMRSLIVAVTVVLLATSAYSSETREHLLGILRLPGLVTTLLLTLVAPLLTYHVVRATKDAFLQKGFGGRDLLKGTSERIPESLGLPTSIVYCMLMCCYIPFRYGMRQQKRGFSLPVVYQDSNTDGGWNGNMHGQTDFPHHELSSYLSSLLSILCSIMLGFLDDVFDIRWRLKMPIPLLASLPMLVVYQAGQGGTSVVVPGWPAFLRTWLHASVVNLGPLYHVFILLLSTFSVHSINILAGINGVEVGQALIIAISLCCNDILYLDPRAGEPGSFASRELRDRHLFSLALLMPFCGCCVGLLAWNRFPARVFVGDTFCYFAGQVLACAGVLGHFSKTLLLFFVPQLINFALSLPQLAGLVPCPRHRVPTVELDTMTLRPSVATFTAERPAKRLTVVILQLFALLHLVHLDWRDDGEKQRRLHSTTNLTILNAILVMSGVRPAAASTGEDDAGTGKRSGAQQNGKTTSLPASGISEEGLWRRVMLFQAFCSLMAFAVRYWLASIVFPRP